MALAAGAALPKAARAQSVAPSYVGAIASGSTIFDITYSGITANVSRSAHIMHGNSPWLKIVLPAWYVVAPSGSNNELVLANGTTWAVGLEYPLGNYVGQFTFGGSGTFLTPPGANAVTDPMPNPVPNGARFWLRIYQANTGGNSLYQDRSNSYFATHGGAAAQQDQANGEGVSINTNGFPPATYLSESWSLFPFDGTQVSNVIIRPAAIIGATTKPSIGALGDSRVNGLFDGFQDGQGAIGEVERSIAPYFGVSRIVRSSETLANFLTYHAKRASLFPYFSHVIEDLGGADFLGGTSYSTVLGYKASLWKLINKPGRTFTLTMPPDTASPDGWVFPMDQSPNTPYSAAFQAWNAACRAGSTGVPAFDVAAAVENTIGSFTWSVAAGAPFTGDGLHENTAGGLRIKNSGAIRIDDIRM